MQTLHNRKKILCVLEAHGVITLLEFLLYARMFDLLALRNIECIAEETRHVTVCVPNSNVTWRVDNTTYCVTEKMDGIASERTFDALDYNDAFTHITVKYANFGKIREV